MSSIEDCIPCIVRTPPLKPAPASPYTRGHMGDGPQAVILAAGQGKRMRGALPKVLHPLGGRPFILYVVEAARAATGSPPVVVTPDGDPRLRDLLGDAAICVEQEAPLGTGHALRSVPGSQRADGPVLV